MFVHFAVGAFDGSLVYIDDWRRIAVGNLRSVSGFWFDCATSIPWSFMDTHYYLVRARSPPPPVPRTTGGAAAARAAGPALLLDTGLGHRGARAGLPRVAGARSRRRRRRAQSSPPRLIAVAAGVGRGGRRTRQDCLASSGAMSPTGSTSSDSRVVRAVKILRILRIARVLKLVKFVTCGADASGEGGRVGVSGAVGVDEESGISRRGREK